MPADRPAPPPGMTVTAKELEALHQIAEAAREIADCPECMKCLHHAVADKLRKCFRKSAK